MYQMLNSDMLSELTAAVFMVLFDTQVGAEPVEHLDDLRSSFSVRRLTCRSR